MRHRIPGSPKRADQVRAKGATSNSHQPKMETTIQTADASKVFRYWGIFAAVIGFLLYANTLGHDYCLDDHTAIKGNYLVKGGLKNVGLLFATEYRYGYEARHNPGSLYRPLTLAVLALEWQLSPDNPSFYHWVNVLLYALTGWALWATWRRIMSGHPAVVPAVAVMVFMAHPVHTEVVANIKSIDEILSLLFGNAALFCVWRHLDCRRKSWLIGAVMLFGLALFSKEGSIAFLVLIPLVIWCFTRRPLRDILGITAFLLVPTGLFLFARGMVLGAQDAEVGFAGLGNHILFAPNLSSRLASAFMMCERYLEVMVFPHPLVSDMGFPQVKPVTFREWRAVAGLILVVGGGAWAVLNLRKRVLAFGILFFFVSFFPVSNLTYLIGTSYGERLMYLPSLGFAFVTAAVLCRGVRWRWGQAPLWVAVSLVVLLYAVKTVTRNLDWKDDFSLCKADYPVSPNSARLTYAYGKQFLATGYDKKAGVVRDEAMVENAIALLSRSLELYPRNYEALGERGWAQARLKRYDKAMDDYRKALDLNPKDPAALNALGYLVHNHLKQPEKAEDLYRRAVEADPRMAEARLNYGVMLANARRFPEAIEQWRSGLNSDPENIKLHRYIAHACLDMGKAQDAREWDAKADALEKARK